MTTEWDGTQNRYTFCIKKPENGKSKKVKTRRVFDDDFKAEIIKMRIAAQLNSSKNVSELSKSFDIGVHQKGGANNL